MPEDRAAGASTTGLPRPPLGTRLRSNLIQAPVFFAATALFGSVSLMASLLERDGAWQHRIARAWAKVGSARSKARSNDRHEC